MDLMEYKAREMFEACGVPVLPGVVLGGGEDVAGALSRIAFPSVVKAQVPMGKRGKAGGVVKVSNESELREAVQKIIGMEIGGKLCRKVMVAPFASIQKEYYLSIILDRDQKCHRIIASDEGGMNIEETAEAHPEKIYQVAVSPQIGLIRPAASYLADKMGLEKPQADQLFAILTNLYKMAVEKYLMQAEINPLILSGDGELIALDAKVTVDDDALYKFPDLLAYREEVEDDALVAEARSFKFLYVPCEPDGDVVVMSNGSGMLMSCIDLLAKNERKTKAVLDLGGGATGERVAEAIRILAKSEGAKQLLINIFGGITRCDEIALGIQRAVSEYGLSLPVVVRFEGTNKQKGLEIVEDIQGVRFADNLPTAVAAIVEGGMAS